MMSYGAYHVWDNGMSRLEISNCPTPADAYDKVAKALYENGWRLPKWWQFWRWDERVPAWLRERTVNPSNNTGVKE